MALDDVRRRMEHILDKHKKNLIPWGAMFVAVLFVYHLLSDGDFSFLLTLGSMMKLFGLSIVLYTVLTEGSAEGLSLKTMQVYCVVFPARLASILTHPGYLPYDSSGDWFYQVVVVAAFAVVVGTTFLTAVTFKPTYEKPLDTFGGLKQLPAEYGIVLLVGPAFVLALLIHPSLNNFWLTDVLWTFALYLESVAVIPQLFMFHQRCKKGGAIPPFTSHFVFSLGAGAVLHMLFWLFSHHELGGEVSASSGEAVGSIVGYLAVFACFVQVALMADFLYFYLKSVKTGAPMVLPAYV